MLRRWYSVVAATLLASAVIPVNSFADEDPRGSGGVHCTKYTCQVEVDVPGQSGNSQAGGNNSTSAPGKSDSSGGGNSTDTRVCKYKLADPQPPAGSLDWEGHQPGDGAVYQQTCGWEDLDGHLITQMVWLAEPPEQETIDPAVLAQRVVDSMTLLGPDIASPRATGRYTVGVPVWMWVNQSATTYGPNTASASAGGVAVTATAKVSKIVWQMGDGSTVTCAGPGTPYRGSSAMVKSPTCGHRYSATSADAPGGRYSVTATSTWTIDWQGGGQSGQLEEIRQSDMQVAVGELQVVR
ncbi:ATP/GTP-binding protein [Streptomyces parvulus]|uniref:ATP/GTP-binding protein n=1 Tax=Streptomyces parvulus TaxID=146923 RepID=UPI0033F03907